MNREKASRRACFDLPENREKSNIPGSAHGPFLLSKQCRICYNAVMQPKTNELKKKVFYAMLDLAGRVFIVARYSENVSIGNRGFTEDEKKNGIVLVFNTSMTFSWDDFGISTTLVFGTSPHKCFIPADDIVAIYSPELNSQLITAAPSRTETSDEEGKAAAEARGEEAGSNVVKVDFTRKRTSRKAKSAGSQEQPS